MVLILNSNWTSLLKFLKPTKNVLYRLVSSGYHNHDTKQYNTDENQRVEPETSVFARDL